MNRRILIIALILAVLLLPAATALAQTPTTLTSSVNLKIRSGPGTGYAQIGSLPAGASAQALGRDAGSFWAYIDYQGTHGWVAAWLATVSGDLDALPVTQPDGTGSLVAATTVASSVTAVPTVNLRMRTGPNTAFATITTIPTGTSVPVLDYDPVADWIKVNYNGQQGWAAAWLATINGDLNSLNAPAPPMESEPAPAPEPANVQITRIHYDGAVYRVESDEYAEIANQGGSPVNLQGWHLNAGDPGQDFWFPAFELAPGQSCRVYTNEYHPESCGFSFGSGQAIWNNTNPDCGHLYDASGAEVSNRCY